MQTSRTVLQMIRGLTSTAAFKTVAISRNASTQKQNTYHPLFSQKKLREDVWMIEEKYFVSWNRANIFFVRGSTADLLVDTGLLTYLLGVIGLLIHMLYYW